MRHEEGKGRECGKRKARERSGVVRSLVTVQIRIIAHVVEVAVHRVQLLRRGLQNEIKEQNGEFVQVRSLAR